MSKEMKWARTTIRWEQKQRSALLSAHCRNLKKGLQKPVKDILFTSKDLCAKSKTERPHKCATIHFCLSHRRKSCIALSELSRLF